MRVNNEAYRSIWYDQATSVVKIIDQTGLPHRFEVIELASLAEAEQAISSMQVRGAPLIGVTAAYGIALAMGVEPGDSALREAARFLKTSRPTAVNLAWAVDNMLAALLEVDPAERAVMALTYAQTLAEDDVSSNRRIAEHGFALLQRLAESKGVDARLTQEISRSH